jgi:hypothetical protein
MRFIIYILIQWHLIAFFFRKMFAAERNYEIEKEKVLAMIEFCRVFRHYVKEALFSIQMLINHVNLNSFFKNKKLNKKEARWWKKLNDLNLYIEYRSSKLNFADDLFRRFDYESNKSIIVNAIAKNDNKLIVNRVHVQIFMIEHNSQKSRKKKWRIIVNFVINEEELLIFFKIKNSEWDEY